MPVERNSQSGVCRVIAGSRITARGIASGCRTLSLTLVAVLVTPALAENSPPAIVVGTLIWRTFGAVIGGGAPLTARMPSMPATLRMSLARQSCTALAPSVIEPPPMVTIRSALASRACSAGRDHGLARRMRRHRIEDRGAAAAERAADIVDDVGLRAGACPRPSGTRVARPAGPSARQSPRPPACRTRPRPWRRKRHVLCARAVLPGRFLFCAGRI